MPSAEELRAQLVKRKAEDERIEEEICHVEEEEKAERRWAKRAAQKAKAHEEVQQAKQSTSHAVVAGE